MSHVKAELEQLHLSCLLCRLQEGTLPPPPAHFCSENWGKLELWLSLWWLPKLSVKSTAETELDLEVKFHLNDQFYRIPTDAVMLSFTLLQGSSGLRSSLVLWLRAGAIACGVAAAWRSQAVLLPALPGCCTGGWLLCCTSAGAGATAWHRELWGTPEGDLQALGHSAVMSSFISTRISKLFIEVVPLTVWQSCKRVVIHLGVFWGK